MGYAFISYSTKNQSTADSLRVLLNSNGIDTWMAPYDIPVGSNYLKVLNKAIGECSCLVLLLTDHAQNSPWVPKEVATAITERKPIIPVQTENITLNDEFEILLSTNQIVAVQKIDTSDARMKHIINTISTHCNGSAPQAIESKPSDNSVAARLRAAIKSFADADIVAEGIDEISKKLEREFSNAKIPVLIEGYEIGLRFIRFRIKPYPNVSLSKIRAFIDDLQLVFETRSICAQLPIPGTKLIGIDIPRRNPKWVRLLDVIKDDKIVKNSTTVAMGASFDGTILFKDAKDFPHLLISGASGSGKSVFINSLIMSILSHATPDDIRLILVDTKRVEFDEYMTLPHLLCPIVQNTKSAINALQYANNEMNRRYEMFMNANVKGLDAYNEYANKEGIKQLPRIFIFVDEFADLMLVDKARIESYILIIAQKARAAGIHLILSTQRPSVDILTGSIKANIPSRVVFRVSSIVDSMVALGHSGAEKLLGHGDMLLYYNNSCEVQRLQAPLVTITELRSFIDALSSIYAGVSYDTTALNEISGIDEKENSEAECEDIIKDECFLEAIDVVRDTGILSTSQLQRKLMIGYTRATKFIDEMKRLEIVEILPSSTKRKTLAQIDEIKLARLIRASK